ncbi:unnamed protein product [Meloidogyne enterolobii]|uniref:Uncharacterized protein n=1 Tax=Meloidogyne enterolobii TaxID=390850 RepID=A0ACB1ANE9_MELEN
MRLNNGNDTSQVADDIDKAWFLAHSMVENFIMKGFISHSKYSQSAASKLKHDEACLEILTKNLKEAQRQVSENEQLINLVLDHLNFFLIHFKWL